MNIDNNRHRCYAALTFGRPGIPGQHSVKRITIKLVAQACQPGHTLLEARPNNQLQTILHSISDLLYVVYSHFLYHRKIKKCRIQYLRSQSLIDFSKQVLCFVSFFSLFDPQLSLFNAPQKQFKNLDILIFNF